MHRVEHSHSTETGSCLWSTLRVLRFKEKDVSLVGGENVISQFLSFLGTNSHMTDWRETAVFWHVNVSQVKSESKRLVWLWWWGRGVSVSWRRSRLRRYTPKYDAHTHMDNNLFHCNCIMPKYFLYIQYMYIFFKFIENQLLTVTDGVLRGSLNTQWSARVVESFFHLCFCPSSCDRFDVGRSQLDEADVTCNNIRQMLLMMVSCLLLLPGYY